MVDRVPAPPIDARAEEIFARTRAAFAARVFPSTMKFKIRVSGLQGTVWRGRTYDAFERPDGNVITHAISEEEAADPVKPPPFTFFGLGSPRRSGLELPGILGFPRLAVNYAFGLARRPAASASESDPATDLRTIGAVRARTRTYDVHLAREEAIDGAVCWHLSLRPLGNPGTYRVRDLWVEEGSYETRRLVTDGNFTAKQTGAGLWTVDFERVGTMWYLASEISQGTVHDGTGSYDRVAVQFLDVVADPHENLDFGIAGSAHDDELVEPPDPPK